MRNLLLSLICLLCSSTIIAHDGRHSNVINKEQAKDISTEIIAKAIKKNALGNSWHNAKLIDAQIVVIDKKNKEWKVSYLNKQVDNKKKQTIYIFLDLDGTYKAMNYTGK